MSLPFKPLISISVFNALLIATPGLAADSPTPKDPEPTTKAAHIEKLPISNARYIGGGILGSVIGFGTGHAVVGEYESMGWMFTTIEGSIVAATIAGSLAGYAGDPNSEFDIVAWATFISVAIGGALWLAIHIWEIVDLWQRPNVIQNSDQTGATGLQDWALFRW